MLVPLLIGAYARVALGGLREAQARAADAEQRRELAERAARLAERSAIARELHGLVAHHVASMALRVGVARHVVPGIDPRVGEVLDDVHAAALTTLADLRRLLAVLRDPAAVADDGGAVFVQPAELPAALAAATDRVTGSGLRVRTQLDRAVDTLDAVRGLAVLRVVQEGLPNVLRHAGSNAAVEVSVEVVDDCARVTVRDDGGTAGGVQGGARARDGAGFGLVGLRERVELVGGHLEAGPADGGWRLAATLAVPTPPPTPAPQPELIR
ncbi:MAG: sensor histidine kinase [Pseudonocardiaceae bacterium]